MARRSHTWVQIRQDMTTIAANAVQSIPLVIDDSFRNITIVRTHGVIISFSDAVSATSTTGAMGMITASENATVAQLPDPLSEPSADWMMHQWIPIQGQDSNVPRSIWIPIDNKSMRKLSGPRQSLHVKLAAGGQGFRVAYAFRFLLKL